MQDALPGAFVSAALHHLPASEMEKLDRTLEADVLVCSDHPSATAATVALVDRIEGLRAGRRRPPVAGGAIESFTAVLTTVNIRHKVHATVRLAGYGDEHRGKHG